MESFDLQVGRYITEAIDITQDMLQHIEVCNAAYQCYLIHVFVSHSFIHTLSLYQMGRVPPLMEIMSFLNHLYQNNQYSPSCNIIALTYMMRMCFMYQVRLTLTNWRLIWISAISLAQKVWDDYEFKSTKFLALIPSASKSQVARAERKFLSLIRWHTTLKPSEYALNYFELRKTFRDITLVQQTEPDCSPCRVLSIVKAKRIEAIMHISATAQLLRKKKSIRKKDSSRRESASDTMVSTPWSCSSDTAVLDCTFSGCTNSSPPIARTIEGGQLELKQGNNTHEDITRLDLSRMVLS